MEIIIPKEYARAEAQKPMTVTFENSEKIIFHPSGVIVKYTSIDLQERKAGLLEEKGRIEEQLIKTHQEMETMALE